MKSLPKLLAVFAVFGAMTVSADTKAPVDGSAPAAEVKKGGVVLTPSEMTARAVSMSQQVKTDEHHVQNLRETIRKQKDVIKLTCVNDKLVEIRPQINHFETLQQSYSGLAGGPDDAVRGAFNDMQSAATAVHETAVAADGCVGTPELYKQESASTDHPVFPDDPTTEDPFGGGNDTVEPPAYASPVN